MHQKTETECEVQQERFSKWGRSSSKLHIYMYIIDVSRYMYVCIITWSLWNQECRTAWPKMLPTGSARGQSWDKQSSV